MLGILIFIRNGIDCTVTYSSGKATPTEDNLSQLGEFYRKRKSPEVAVYIATVKVEERVVEP